MAARRNSVRGGQGNDNVTPLPKMQMVRDEFNSLERFHPARESKEREMEFLCRDDAARD